MRVWSLAAAALVVVLMTSGCLGSGGGLFGGAVEPKDYLSDKTYTKWVIELDAMQGQGPSSSILGTLHDRLASVANKPAGIEIKNDETNIPSRGGTWSDKDVSDFEAAHRDHKTSGSTVVTHLLFVDGNSVHDDPNGAKVLGVAYGHDTIILFSEAIRNSCTAATLCFTGTDSVFRAVIVHEFGHAMGLVNNGIAMVHAHEDSAHPGHSNNQNSVMYYAVETTDIANIFRNGPPTDFDANDRQDLCKAGGKC